MRLRVYIPGNRARERLVVFLGPLLQTFNQICPRNMKMKRFLLKKLLIYKNELKMQVTVFVGSPSQRSVLQNMDGCLRIFPIS